MKYLPHFLYYYGFASAFSFIVYGLNPEEKSNLYFAVIVFIVIILLSEFFSYIKHEQSGEIMDSFKSFSNTIVTSTRDSQQQNNNNP